MFRIWKYLILLCLTVQGTVGFLNLMRNSNLQKSYIRFVPFGKMMLNSSPLRSNLKKSYLRFVPFGNMLIKSLPIPKVEWLSRISYAGQNGKKVATNTVSIIRANGYQAETHEIETEDGYILEIHRIPKKTISKYPVLIMHGNFQSSADWVINAPSNNSLAFILSEMGYDVWLGNHRGNTYSKRHKNYTLHSHEFWDYSFHELGKYDLPAMIDYILKQTGAKKLHYLSFSYSSTAFFAGLSTRPEYNAKVASGIVMGPSVFQAYFLFGLIYFVSFTAKFVDAFIEVFGAVPILPHFVAKLLTSLVPVVCNPKVDVLGFCWIGLNVIFGHDGGLIKKSQLPLITSVAPSSSGLRAWNHIVQLTGSRNFAQYDYGLIKNLNLYGMQKPPEYNLTLVTTPVVLMVGRNDYLASRRDAKTLASRLPNLVEFYDVPYKKFTHLDFTYGRDVAAQAYLHAIEVMQRYN